FSSTLQDPAINNATAAAAGTYTVTVTAGGMTSTASTTVAVRGQNQSCEDGNHCTIDTCLGTTHLSEGFDSGAPAGWPSNVLPPSPPGTTPWWLAGAFSIPPPASAATDSPPNVSDKDLRSPSFVPGAGATVRFQNRYNLEQNYDGAVLEIKIGA